jgi:hypothetical protein
MPKEQVIFCENFEEVTRPPTGWWVEGGQMVWIEDGHLHVRADPEEQGQPGYVCTVWNAKKFSGDIRVEYDAHVVDSAVDANNVNFFLLYSDPSGESLYKTRDTRSNAEYGHYHVLNGYIFTFLNDFQGDGGTYPDGSTRARMRMRRCPGFQLMTETYDYHCRQGMTYHLAISKVGGDLSFAVDGEVYLQGHDDTPWTEGLIGLRTFRTQLWWDNIVVTAIT